MGREHGDVKVLRNGTEGNSASGHSHPVRLSDSLAAQSPMTKILTVLFLFLALPTYAQESTGLRRTLEGSYIGLQVLDLHSTHRALATGLAREGNPLVASEPVRIGAKAALSAFTVFAMERVAKKHPHAAWVTLAAINGFYVGIVAHNYRVGNLR